MALTKVSGGILDPGINVAGIVTATGFDGPFTGGSGSNITAGIGTFTELDINGNVDISGNLTVHGDQTTLNTTLREVELLRVDAAANVAAGIITQTGNGHGLVLADDTTLKMAMNVGSGIATFRALNAGYGNHNGASGIFQQVDLNTAGVTFGNQISVNGATIAIGGNSHRIRSAANDFAIEHTTSSYKGFRFLGNVPENTLVVSNVNSGSVGIGSQIPSEKLDVNGNIKASGKIIAYDATSTSNQIRARIKATASSDDGRVGVYHGNTEIAALFGEWSGSAFSTGLNIPYEPFTVTGTSGAVRLSITTTGNVIIGTNTWQYEKPLNVQGSSGHIISLYNGDTGTYAANTLSGIEFKLRTGNTGNQIASCEIRAFKENGTNGDSARGLSFYTGVNGGSPNERLRIASDGVLKIERGSASDTALEINTTSTSNACRIKFNESGSNKAQIAYSHDNDRLELVSQSGNGIAIYSGGNLVWKFDTNGHLLPHIAGAVDIGSASAEIGNVYIADDKRFYAGSDQNISLYHTSSNGINHLVAHPGNFMYHSGTHYFTNAAQSQLYAQFIENSYCELRHAGAQKIKTSETGIDVTGEVSATQDYPTIQPTLNFNFAATKKLDPRITYSRTGSASFVNEFGKIVIVGHNTPRFNHNPTTRECEGLLIEGQRTNRIIYSSDYKSNETTLYSFSSYEGVFSENFGTAPDGSLTDAFLGEGNTGRHTLYIKVQAVGGQLSDNTKYSMSIFVKRVSDHSNERYCKLETASYSTWTHSGSSAVFDLSNGTEVTSPSSNITSGIETYPNGWFRIHFETTTGTVATNTGFYLNICNSAGSTGSSTLTSSQGLLLYGTQMEAGAFPTSYIHTNGSVETRGHDKVTIDGEDFTDFYNQLESTVVCEFDSSNWITYNNTSYERVWSINNGSESDVFEIFKQNTLNNAIRYRVRDGAANVLAAANITYGTNTTPKTAFALKLNDAAVAVDGTTDGTTDSTIPMPTPDRLVLGNDDVSNNNSLHGHIRKFMYYPVKLPDSQVVTLTS